MLTEESRLAASPEVLSRALGAETVLLDLASERYLGLDEPGTSFWNALVTAPSIGAALETLLSEYEVEPERLRADLLAFAETLLAAGLVRLESRAGAP